MTTVRRVLAVLLGIPMVATLVILTPIYLLSCGLAIASKRLWDVRRMGGQP